MAFNVDHLLNTHSTPSQEQRNYLQNSILQLDEDISCIDEEILAMQAKILVSQTRRTQLVQQRRCYSSLLSPVRCLLPIEILGEIFVYATRDRPGDVLNIHAVCQLWRYAALSTPRLWSTLELGHHTTRRNMQNHIDLWTERAHSYPLSLSLIIRNQHGFLDSLKNALTLILITNLNHHWKSITLDSDASGRSILSILEKLEFSNLEMLESFSLTTRFYSRLSLPDSLRHTPKLNALTLNVQYYAFDTLPFPWRQLTSLTITFWAWDNDKIGGDILRACENLEEFIMDGESDASDGSGSNHGSDSAITLNNLRKLHTRCNDKMFLLSIKAPSIQDFAMEASGLKYFYDKGFYDYIIKIGPTLLKLSIAPSHSRLVEGIPYLRSLVELRLYDSNHGDDGSVMMCEILSSLVVDPEMEPSTIPLPRLEALEIICQATEANQRMFVNVIDSRWWSDEENARQKQGQRSLSRIKRSVLMNIHTDLNRFCRDDVDVLRAQGMIIEYLAPFDGMDEDDFYTSRLQ